MGMRRRWGVLVAFVTAMVLFCAGCGGSSSVTHTGKASFYTGGAPGGTPVHGGTATIDLGEQPNSLDPIATNYTPNADLSLEISEGLVESVAGKTALQPDLASSWTISPDGLTYTFHIREGVKFSNGEPLTGEDVVYSIERQKLPLAGYGAIITTPIKKVSLAGPMTVQVQLKHVTGSFLSYFGLTAMGIVPKNVVEHESQKAFALHPIGTGPYLLKSAAPGFTKVVMVRNPNYWRSGQPYLNELVWNVVLESNARILAVRAGNATIDLGVPFSQVSELQSSASGDRVLIQPLYSESLAYFNLWDKGVFSNANVRKALNYATPREEIVKAVFKGLATPANVIANNQFQYYDASVPTFPYDIAKAKELLKDSPVPHGFSTSMIIYSGEPNSSLIASILQSSYAKIGVHLSIKELPPASVEAELTKLSFDMFLWTPEVLVAEQYNPFVQYGLSFGATATLFKIPDQTRGNSLIEEANGTLNESTASKRWAELQRFVNWEEAYYAPIAFTPAINLVSGAVRGFSYPPTSYVQMREVWLAH